MQPNHNGSTGTAAGSPIRGAEPLALNPDRFFDPDPAVRAIARSLFDETAGLPLVCPHGHVDPQHLADDAPFPEPASLLIVPDHYIFRLLHARGVPMQDLGV